MSYEAPQLNLMCMQQQREVGNSDEDWTGLSSAAKRRKLQNRLNQRTYRKHCVILRSYSELIGAGKRRQAKKANISSSSGSKLGTSAVTLSMAHQAELLRKFRGLIDAEGQQEASQRWLLPLHSHLLSPAQLLHLASNFELYARQTFLFGSPRADLLPTLIQCNVFRALISNTQALKFTLSWLESENAVSPFTCTSGISPINDSSTPASLSPTSLQKSVPHHPWIDLWPIPQMRDNLLLAIARDEVDEDALCNDLLEFSDERKGMLVRDNPWDQSSWELSEPFVTKWGWCIKDCEVLKRSTNCWRERRGEEPLVWEV